MDDPAIRSQLLGVIATHVLPRLTVRDLQAIGQCSTEFRHLVHDSLSASTWRNVAENSFPLAHPVLLVDSANIRAKVNQLAARRAALCSDQLLVEASINLWPADRPSMQINSPAVASHAGTQLIALQGGQVRLWELDATSHTVQQTCSKPSPEIVDAEVVESADCQLVWSADDQLVALAFTICNYEDERAEFNENGWFSVVYVLQVADFSLHEIAVTAEISSLQPVRFIPESNMLVLPWDSIDDDECHIDIYNPKWQHVVRISDPDIKIEARLAFSRDGQLMAVGHPTNVYIYGLDGQLKYKMEAGGDAGQQFYDVAWSPAGDQIFLWQGRVAPARLNIFDCTSHALVASHPMTGLPDIPTIGLPKPLLLIASFSAAAMLHCRTSYYPGFFADVQLTTLESSHLEKPLAAFQSLTVPAFSPDGAFVAVISPVMRDKQQVPALHILETQRGVVVREFQPEAWQALDVMADLGRPFLALTWSASDNILLARTYISSGGQLNKETLTLISF